MSYLNHVIVFLLVSLLALNVSAQQYKSYTGLVMTGYQGWFNTPYDAVERGWRHYGGKQGFQPGSCSIDFWPDVSEYKIIYQTDFKHDNGIPAYTFSSNDPSTVDIHFQWMQEYGIDGAFMQRFVTEIKQEKGKAHFDRVFHSAFQSAQNHSRAISIMYDLSGMLPGDEQLLLNDIDRLEQQYHFKKPNDSSIYLYHNEKPLVAVWGIGFNDRRKYGLNEASNIIEGLKQRGYSILIGVPTYWRELNVDTQSDARLHKIIRRCDILLPWTVGRYNETSYDSYKPNIQKDMEWCAANNVDYAPLCYPGFSWKNMRGVNSFYVDRNSGSFFRKQFSTLLQYGAKRIYVAMFDEIDEGTAIFKCVNKSQVPHNGKIAFEGIEDSLPTDYYLQLTGEASQMLKRKITSK